MKGIEGIHRVWWELDKKKRRGNKRTAIVHKRSKSFKVRGEKTVFLTRETVET